MIGLAFGPTNSLSLKSNTEKEGISSTKRGSNFVLHVGSDLLWHPNAFGLIVGLFVHLDGHHLVIFLLFNKYGVEAFLSTLLV